MPEPSEKEYQEALAVAQKERDLLLGGVCPECLKKTMESKLAGLQGGVSQLKGSWWTHRCSSCGYSADLIHPDD